MSDFRPMPQPCKDVLFFNASAPAGDLFDTADLRMDAALNLLRLLEFSDNLDFTQHQAARLSAAISVLLDDARVLYEASHQRWMQAMQGL
ncbi:hypothetical protein FXN65_03450 [Metapseudomonas lalkuanensis]|uniref:Uncharacterized protein n=1 Tax=Metapseudomonas lalkuanensis TaxID=2604832 RepID=A0A5J6QGV7_9GAMM|nr:hypothetical protein [Pseudomonas lalkuanensis]QEY61145.1 hypothetical protein FXN65_03450 [Pseudomonas lalkuanensis]